MKAWPDGAGGKLKERSKRGHMGHTASKFCKSNTNIRVFKHIKAASFNFHSTPRTSLYVAQPQFFVSLVIYRLLGRKEKATDADPNAIQVDL